MGKEFLECNRAAIHLKRIVLLLKSERDLLEIVVAMDVHTLDRAYDRLFAWVRIAACFELVFIRCD
jgi:hypothetical protein